jgi:hypothetical protein
MGRHYRPVQKITEEFKLIDQAVGADYTLHVPRADDKFIERHDPVKWQQLHKESMARLALREKPLPGRNQL